MSVATIDPKSVKIIRQFTTNAATIATMTVDGVATLDIEITLSKVNGQVTMTIPRFQILTYNAGAFPSIISLEDIPAEFLPTKTCIFNIMIGYGAAPTTPAQSFLMVRATGEIYLTDAPFLMGGGTSFDPNSQTPYGLCATWNANSIFA